MNGKRLGLGVVIYLALVLIVAGITVPVSMDGYERRPDHARVLSIARADCDESCGNDRLLMQGWMFNHVVYDTGKALLAMTGIYVLACATLMIRRRRN